MNKPNIERDDFLVFAASLQNLSKEEIRQAKLLYIKNAIVEYKSYCHSYPLFLLLFGSVCIVGFFIYITVFPLFSLLPLLFFYIIFSSTQTGLRASKQGIDKAIEIWKEDLGDDYFLLKAELERIK